MSQQVFDKYWPVGNVDEETAIPGSAILQTRDDKDEPINLAGAMVWDADSSLWVPVSENNPLEARVRHLEELIGGAVENPTQYTLAARIKRIEDMLESGGAKITLSGRNAVSYTLVDALEIRSTNTVISSGAVPAAEIGRYKTMGLFVMDTHDQAMAIRLWRDTSSPAAVGAYRGYDVEDGGFSAADFTTAASSTVTLYVAHTHPRIKSMIENPPGLTHGLRVRIVPSGVPTTGSLTVIAVGVVN